jgi:RHS repeat-associated protein
MFLPDHYAPGGASQMQIGYEVTLDKGWLAFSNASLERRQVAYTISRKTYFLGSQAIATRVSGDPDGNNGLFYIHTDHLGSASLMSDADGQKVEPSVARYLPYGRWRTEPTADLTDRAYTGQKHNMDIGLYYYNARYYAPGVGRFISADTLVPDPTNPQQFNRYSYVLGNPLRYTDPTGHWTCVADANYDACQSTIQGWLDLLQNGGEIGQGVYLWFLDFDQEWIEKNGYGVLFEFKDISFGAQVPFCGGATGLCSLLRDSPKIEVRAEYLNSITVGKAALLAHEFVHWYQGDITAASVLGEAQAYLVEALILREFGQTPDRLRQTVFADVFDRNSYGTVDLTTFKEALVVAGYTRLLPSGCFACGSATNQVLFPAYHFQQLGQLQQWQIWSREYGMY